MRLLTTLQRGLVTLLVTILLTGAASPVLRAAPFITPDSLDVAAILPPAPVSNSAEAKADNAYIKYSNAAATENQKILGIAASRDSVFDDRDKIGH